MLKSYDSKRILTVKELSIGQTIHSGFTGGFCVKWKVIAINGTKAFLSHKNGTVCNVDGIQLRKDATYRADSCPLCDLQHEKRVDSSQEIKFLKQDLTPSIVASSFKFREAQFVMRRRNASR